ncbi:MAG TPA: efflux RND transporter periplasmic adaptor subunit [Micromonosporaceae bacterium]
MRRRLWYGLGGALVVAATATTFVLTRSPGDASQARYLTATVTRRTVADTISATGTVQPERTLALAFAGGGGGGGNSGGNSGGGSTGGSATSVASGATVVTSVTVTVGQQVKAGQVLARIDDSAQRQAVASAEAHLAAAQARADASVPTTPAPAPTRSGQPAPSPASTAQQAAQHQADLASVNDAQQQVASAKAALAATALTAPVAGVVTAVDVAVGLPAPAGAAVQMRTGSMIVQASIGEADVAKLQVGQAAQVVFTALGATAPAKVATLPTAGVSSGANANAVVTFPVQLTLDRPVDRLLPGMSAQVVVTIASKDNVLAVPSSAVNGGRGRYTVQVLRNGAPVTRSVEIGLATAGYTEIVSGLTEGETVVVGVVGATTGASPTARPNRFGGGLNGPGGGFGGPGGGGSRFGGSRGGNGGAGGGGNGG